MADAASENQVNIPVYGAFTIYPNGSRDETESKQFDGPCTAPVGPRDWFGFDFWALADVEDDDLKRFADAVAHIPRLRSFNIGGCERVTDRGLNQIARFEQLEDLCMNSIRRNTSRGLSFLERLPHLVKLNLEFVRNVNDATAKIISRLSRLEDLNLNQCPDVTDAGIAHLCKLTGLKSLGVNDAKITDRGIESVASLRELKGLSLPTNCRMTDRGLARLGELPHLAYLSLPNCSGFIRRLLTGGGISRKGLERFRQAKPECDLWSWEIYNETQKMLASLPE
jgi:hypothetical protein